MEGAGVFPRRRAKSSWIDEEKAKVVDEAFVRWSDVARVLRGSVLMSNPKPVDKKIYRRWRRGLIIRVIS